EIRDQRIGGEVAWIELVQARSPHRAAGHQPVGLQTSERLLDAGERALEETRQLAGIAVTEEAQGDEHVRARLAAERAGGHLDRHSRSYDHICWSKTIGERHDSAPAARSSRCGGTS